MEQFAVSERAAARIAEIIAAESSAARGLGGAPGGAAPGDSTSGEAAPGEATPALRVAVLAGGCSGFQYRFELDIAQQADDLVIERAGARVVVDPVSLDLLAGGELDFTDELMGSHFAVRNPNAKSACGCGTSFSVD
jgi:iron-sulfur cluster assembly accessory protein